MNQKEQLLYFQDLLGVLPRLNRTTLWRWIKSGRFPKPKRIGNGRNIWFSSDIQEWIKALKANSK